MESISKILPKTVSIRCIKYHDLITKIDDISIIQYNRLIHSHIVDQRPIGTLQILQVPATVIKKEAGMTARNCTPLDNKIIAIGTTNRCDYLVETIGVTAHWPILNGETSKHRTAIRPKVAVMNGSFIGEFISAGGTKKACAGIRCSTTKAWQRYNWLLVVINQGLRRNSPTLYRPQSLDC